MEDRLGQWDECTMNAKKRAEQLKKILEHAGEVRIINIKKNKESKQLKQHLWRAWQLQQKKNNQEQTK